MGTGSFPVGSWIFLIFIMTCLDIAKAIYCYRCDSLNHGSTCDVEPATRHLRDYGEEEPCLQYEEVNNQFLALQKDHDSQWYYSANNGDHGLPVHILLPEEPIDDDTDERGSLTLLHADRDLTCLFVRSTFHHSIDYQVNDNLAPANSPHTIYFRKCVQLPSLDRYPVCKQAKIYKGSIELCVCRTDKCNFNHIDSDDNHKDGELTRINGKDAGTDSGVPSAVHLPPKLYFYLFTTVIFYLLK